MAKTARASLDDVLMTAELSRRPARVPDYEAESRALIALAVRESSPQSMLQRVAESALTLCRAGSAGISILEPDGKDGILRWDAVAGELSPHVGRRFYRKACPCGTVFDRNTTLLFAYPDRHFDYGGMIAPAIVELLMVPFSNEEHQVGTLWVMAHSPSRRFDTEDQRVLTSLSRVAATIYHMKTAIVTAEAERTAVADQVRQTFDTSATALTRCSRDLRYLSVNPAYVKMVGLPAEEIIGHSMIEVLGAKALDVIRPRIERVLRGERVEYDEEIPLSSGAIRFLHVVSTPCMNAAGEVDGWVSSISDISDLKQATMELQEREQRLRLALDASAAGVWTWDPFTNQTTWDSRLRAQYGYVEDVSPTFNGWISAIHEEDRSKVLAHLEEVLSGRLNEWNIIFRAVKTDGAIAWMHALGRADRAPDGQVIRMSGINLDITDRRRAEDVLRESEERDAFLLRLADTLRPLSDPRAVQEAVGRLLCKHLRANRVNYVEIDGTDFIVKMSYANGVAPLTGRWPIKAFGASMLEGYKRDERVVVNDIRTDPKFTDNERARWTSRDVVAFVGIMLVKDKKWSAGVGVHSVTPRVWTKSEIELIRDVAQRVFESVERAAAEEALREREQRLSFALDASAAGIWTWDPSTDTTRWDDRFHAQYGFPKGAPQNFDTWISRVHEEDRPKVSAHIEEVLHRNQNEWNIIFRVVWPSGAVGWMHSLGRAERDAGGQITRMSGINLDITERRRAEEALQALRDEERDRTLQLLLETAAQGILSMDASGVIMTANRTLETMFGWAPGELTGKPVELLLPSAVRERHAAHRAGYFAAPRPRLMGGGLDLVGQRKDGTTFPVEVSLNHVVTPDGGHAIAFVTDITARREAEEALRQSHAALEERTAELERRTAQLSRLSSELTLAEQNTREQLAKTLHDGLQQLLFIAKVGLERLSLNGDAQNDDHALLEEVRADIEEAISASRSLSMELFPPALHVSGLPAAVKWLAKWMEEKYGLVVQAAVDPLANSDRKDIRTLVFESLRELLFNAVKHAKVDRVAIELAVGPNDTLCVTVTDQGIGFDPAPLFSKAIRQQKAGWGLFSIRERLMLLSGRLEIESTPGVGTRFRIVVPRGEAQGLAAVVASRDAIAPVPIVAAESVSRQIRILIVDDHRGVRASLRRILGERTEFQVVGEAADGLEAIDQAYKLRPDAVVMDISMPRMDGVDATRLIHAELPSIQIFGLSSAEMSGSPHPIEKAGASGYFVKGTDMQRLIASLLAVSTSRAMFSGRAS
jgi:PAS domain S-box-containing protein